MHVTRSSRPRRQVAIWWLVVGVAAATGACAQIVGISDGFHGESDASSSGGIGGGATTGSAHGSSVTGQPATGSSTTSPSSSTSTNPIASATGTGGGGVGGAPQTTAVGAGGATSTVATGTGGGATTSTSTLSGGLGDGTACNDPATCASGHCSQGFCCDVDCAAQCMTCNGQHTTARPGTCGPIDSGFGDAFNPCVMHCDAASSTWFSDECDGTGACDQAPCGEDVVCNGTNDCRTCQSSADCLRSGFEFCDSGACTFTHAAGGGGFNCTPPMVCP
jgi:hypothetical protein